MWGGGLDRAAECANTTNMPTTRECNTHPTRGRHHTTQRLTSLANSIRSSKIHRPHCFSGADRLSCCRDKVGRGKEVAARTHFTLRHIRTYAHNFVDSYRLLQAGYPHWHHQYIGVICTHAHTTHHHGSEVGHKLVEEGEQLCSVRLEQRVHNVSNLSRGEEAVGVRETGMS